MIARRGYGNQRPSAHSSDTVSQSVSEAGTSSLVVTIVLAVFLNPLRLASGERSHGKGFHGGGLCGTSSSSVTVSQSVSEAPGTSSVATTAVSALLLDGLRMTLGKGFHGKGLQGTSSHSVSSGSIQITFAAVGFLFSSNHDFGSGLLDIIDFSPRVISKGGNTICGAWTNDSGFCSRSINTGYC